MTKTSRSLGLVSNRTSAWVLCLCIWAACGDEQANTTPGDTGSAVDASAAEADMGDITVDVTDVALEPEIEETDPLVTPLAAALCDWVSSCCAVEELRAALGIADTVDGLQMAQQLATDDQLCRFHVEAWMWERYQWALSAIEAGRSALNDAALETCFNWYQDAALSCNIGRDLMSGQAGHPCSMTNLLDGLQADGESCLADYECEDGRLCDLLDGQPGWCRDPIVTGNPCRSTVQCETDAYCSGTTVGICSTPVVNPDGYCETDIDCSPNSFCSRTIQRCTTRFEYGEPCTAGNVCSTGYCDDLTSLCYALSGVGSQCTSDAMCADGSYCSTDEGTIDNCEAVEYVGLGEPCTATGIACGAGLVCEAGACVEKAAAGGLCPTDDYCPDDFFCHDNVCTSRLAEGSDCVRDRQCLVTLWCADSDLCETRTALGEECVETAECAAGTWCETDAEAETSSCVAVAGMGSDCSTTPCGDNAICRHYVGVCTAGVSQGEFCEEATWCGDRLYCRPPDRPLSVCRSRRVVGHGEMCTTQDVECEEGLVCSTWCRLQAAEGEPCGSSVGQDLCAEGLQCLEEVCTAPAAVGAACGEGITCVDTAFCDEGFCASLLGEGGTCYGDSQCQAPLFCHWGNEQCTTLYGVGGACYLDTQCEATLYCNTSEYACAERLATGGGCSRDRQCLDGDYCSPGHICAPPVAAGEACVWDRGCVDGTYCKEEVCAIWPVVGETCDLTHGCGDGTWCDPASLVCTAQVGLDEECAATAACTSDYYCRSVAGTCEPVGIEGDACPSGDVCGPDLVCLTAGFCRDRIAAGEPCDPLSSLCVVGAVCDETARRCSTYDSGQSTGASCVADVECASFDCEGGICVTSCEGL